MFGRAIPLFRLFGFSVKLDLSWFFIAFFVAWSLAAGFFPSTIGGLSTTTYWIMGVAGALGLFASIVLHEFGHSLMARRYGLAIRGITLFIFGGVAELEDEPRSPQAEFMVAIAGPLVTAVIALICFWLGGAGEANGWPPAVTGVIQYLALINAGLLVFNLIPAFPLDGGRVLRSILWKVQGSLRRATRITSLIGSGFGFLLIGFGILSLFLGNLIGGIWMALIGLFLRNAATMSYQQLLVRQALEGEPVRRFMNPEPITVPPAITLRELADEYIYRHYHKLFPVVDQGQLAGCVTVDRLKEVPRDTWDERRVADIVQQCTDTNTIDAGADAVQALSKMSRTGSSRLMVTEGGQLAGIITLKDLMRFLSLRIELEDNEPAQAPTAGEEEQRRSASYERASIER